MLRCRAKEEWICHTGGGSRTSQRPTTANQTKQTLTSCGQFGGMEEQGAEGIRQWSRRAGDCIHKDRDRMGGP